MKENIVLDRRRLIVDQQCCLALLGPSRVCFTTLSSHLGIPHDVTKIQTTKLSILLRFYFYDVLEQLKTNFHTVFASKGFLVLC